MSWLFQNVNICSPDQTIDDGEVLVEDKSIIALGKRGSIPHPADCRLINGQGMTLASGFIDLQLNGGFGFDFTRNPADIWPAAACLPKYGVTAFLPTIITSPLDIVEHAIEAVNHRPASWEYGAIPLGLHLEGPFINPGKKGAHDPAYIHPPDLALVGDWTRQNRVLLVTLAPELPGGLELASHLLANGVVVSAGHSLATFEQARSAFDLGIRYATHLFNAMPPLDHRVPGLAGAALSDMRVVAGVIVDGVHVHPSVVELAWKIKGSRGLSLVTDAIAAMGMPPGEYSLGDRTITVDGTVARLPDGTLAGSILTLDQAVRNLMAFTGCSLAEALPCVTLIPANLLGLELKGCIAPGCDADLTLLTPDGHVMLTMVGGEILYSK